MHVVGNSRCTVCILIHGHYLAEAHMGHTAPHPQPGFLVRQRRPSRRFAKSTIRSDPGSARHGLMINTTEAVRSLE
jgi:hypothetical protein